MIGTRVEIFISRFIVAQAFQVRIAVPEPGIIEIIIGFVPLSGRRTRGKAAVAYRRSPRPNAPGRLAV